MARTTATRSKTGNSRFASIPSVSTPRSAFNRSRGHKTTFDGGFLIPIAVDELLPGDTFKCRTLSFVRMLTALTPIMDQMWIDTFWFFVPNRLLWENWEKFMGAQDNPGDSISFLVPAIDFDTIVGPPVDEFAAGTIFDYMGIPPYIDYKDVDDISALHLRAYNLIWNEWFRPQDIQDSVIVNIDDGPDDANDYTLLRRAKRHDYFTSALPAAQKGSPIQLPFGTQAPLVGSPEVLSNVSPDQSPIFTIVGGAGGDITDVLFNTGGGSTDVRGPFSTTAGDKDLIWDTPNLHTDLAVSGVYADLSAAAANTINAIREATTLQQFQEREARGGTRYTEQITSQFGVRSPDARLQRPEYLGGSSDEINVHPTAATAETGGVQVGDLRAFVTGGSGGSRSFTYSATEHGVVLGLCMVRANLTYQQGLHRMWSRSTRFDFAWPIFAQLGEQEVLNKEINIVGTGGPDNTVFGYQERYAEYRYAENRLSGLFRSSDPVSLDIWHLAQDFSSTPSLNTAFIEENPPFLRTVSVQDEPIFKGDFWFDINHVRPLPVYSVPGLSRF